MLRYTLALAGTVAFVAAAHADDARGFDVTFLHCSEFAGWGPVGTSAAQALVPSGYTLAMPAAGNASIVVRVTSCASAVVDGSPPMPTIVSHVGIGVASPDGTGDINNYTLLYVSNNPHLVKAFWGAGLPAKYDPALVYEYTLNAAGTGGTLYASVPNPGVPAYFFYGQEGEPAPNSAVPFLANWWYGAHGAMKQSTNFPMISFGSAAVTFYTSSDSVVGKLIGGNTDVNFPFFNARGEYAQAHMTVTASGR